MSEIAIDGDLIATGYVLLNAGAEPSFVIVDGERTTLAPGEIVAYPARDPVRVGPNIHIFRT